MDKRYIKGQSQSRFVKYLKELQNHEQLLDRIRLAEREYQTITLLYAAHDPEHNNAVVLLDLLKETLVAKRQINYFFDQLSLMSGSL